VLLLQQLPLQLTQLSQAELLMIVLGFVFIIVLMAVGLTELSEHLRQRRILKEMKKDPELWKRYLEAQASKAAEERRAKLKKAIPELVPKSVKVIVLGRDGNYQLEDLCRYDGEVITCKRIKMQFFPPQDYRPKQSFFKKKLLLTYYFDEQGRAIEIKTDGNGDAIAIAKAPDPRIAEVIINRRLIYQIFSRLGASLGAVVAGIGLGAMIMSIVIFVILPAMGVPVAIGRQPVEVHVQPLQVQPTPIPPANYTVNIPTAGGG